MSLESTGYKGILEFLREATGCEYLSDLHSRVDKAALYSAVSGITVESYSADEWRECLSYITGSVRCGTSEQIKSLLLNELCNQLPVH